MKKSGLAVMIQKKNTDVILENTARHGNGKTLILSTNIIQTDLEHQNLIL